MRLKTVFMGTPDFSVPSLDLLSNHPDINLIQVVSLPDRPVGRKHSELKSPEVIEYCKTNKIPFLQTQNINKEEDFFNQDVDLIIVIAFSQFLSEKVLSLPKIGAFNVHTSILPKYRGAAPIHYAILNGDSSSGVSIQKMVKKMDAGDIAHFDEVLIQDNETTPQLYTRLKFQAALSLNTFISKIKNNDISYTQQNEGDVSFAPVIKKEEGLINPLIQSHEKIIQMIRAFMPWPGTFTFINNKRVKIFEVEVVDFPLEPGELKIHENKLLMGTTLKSLRLRSLQLEGKKISTDEQVTPSFKGELKITI